MLCWLRLLPLDKTVLRPGLYCNTIGVWACYDCNMYLPYARSSHSTYISLLSERTSIWVLLLFPLPLDYVLFLEPSYLSMPGPRRDSAPLDVRPPNLWMSRCDVLVRLQSVDDWVTR